jgi:hypothetical protein
VRRNSDATGSWRRLRWPGTSGHRLGGPGVHHEVLGRRDGVVAMLNGRADRAIHIQTPVVHGREHPVEEMGTEFVEKPLSTRAVRPQDHRCGMPEAKAALTQRAKLAYRRAGERRA